MSASLAAAVAVARARLGDPAEIALILGSGLGGVAAAVDEPRTLPYAEIPGFPVPTAPGHAGELVAGHLHGRRVVVMRGRLHLYEGRSAAEIGFAVRVLAALGAGVLLVTNAAGGLDPALRPGELMLIDDHLNFTGANPLVGLNDPSVGVRFPDMSRAYDPELGLLAMRAAREAGVPLRRGVYAGIVGPSLETSAERRFLRAAGGDAVGMSTVVEVIAAVHAGMRVVGLSAITNAATGGPEQAPDSIEAVLAVAAEAGSRIAAILARMLPAV